MGKGWKPASPESRCWPPFCSCRSATFQSKPLGRVRVRGSRSTWITGPYWRRCPTDVIWKVLRIQADGVHEPVVPAGVVWGRGDRKWQGRGRRPRAGRLDLDDAPYRANCGTDDEVQRGELRDLRVGRGRSEGPRVVVLVKRREGAPSVRFGRGRGGGSAWVSGLQGGDIVAPVARVKQSLLPACHPVVLQIVDWCIRGTPHGW